MDDLAQSDGELLDDFAQTLARLTHDGHDPLLSGRLEAVLAVIGDQRHLAALDTTVEQQQAARHIREDAQAVRKELDALRHKWEVVAARIQERVRHLEQQLDERLSEGQDKDRRLRERSAEAEHLRSELDALRQRLRSTQEQLEEAKARIRRLEAEATRPVGTADRHAEEKVKALLGEGSAQPTAKRADPPASSQAMAKTAGSPAGLWTRVAEGAFPLRGAMRSLTAGGPGVVAVGHDDSSGHAAVWVSNDGLTWERIRGQTESLGGGSRVVMYAVTRGGPGLVAVGADADQGRPVAWTSVDGHTWHRAAVDDLDAAGKGICEMRSVVSGGPSLVAVGYDETRRAAAVWTSTTGETWERIAHDESVFGGDGQQLMSEVICGGPGLVAVGRERASRQTGLIWVSNDGRTWTRLDRHGSDVRHDLLRAMRKREVRAVTAFGTSLVAVGRHVDGPAVWISEDGTIWSRVSLPHQAGCMTSVAVVASQLIAVGFRSSRPSVWSSPDGLSWSRSEYDEQVFDEGVMHSVATTEQGVVAVGKRRDHPAVWRFYVGAAFGRM